MLAAFFAACRPRALLPVDRVVFGRSALRRDFFFRVSMFLSDLAVMRDLQDDLVVGVVL